MDNQILTDFGKKIRSIREKRGLSQEKFALLIGMDRTYYASVESGRRNIALKNIKKIADGFQMSLKELFNGMEE